MKIDVKVKLHFDAKKMMTALRRGVTGDSAGGMSVIIGPTTQAWYGKLHEYGFGKFPARPFMRPALNLAMKEIPALFQNLIKEKDPPYYGVAVDSQSGCQGAGAVVLLDVCGGTIHRSAPADAPRGVWDQKSGPSGGGRPRPTQPRARRAAPGTPGQTRTR